MSKSPTQAERFSRDWTAFTATKEYDQLIQTHGYLKFIPYAIQIVLINYPGAKVKESITFSDNSSAALTKKGFKDL